jgi:hypothetical protein
LCSAAKPIMAVHWPHDWPPSKRGRGSLVDTKPLFIAYQRLPQTGYAQGEGNCLNISSCSARSQQSACQIRQFYAQTSIRLLTQNVFIALHHTAHASACLEEAPPFSPHSSSYQESMSSSWFHLLAYVQIFYSSALRPYFEGFCAA